MDEFRIGTFVACAAYIIGFLGIFAIYIYPLLNTVVGGPAPFPITWLTIIGCIVWFIPGIPIFIIASIGLLWAATAN